MRHNDIQDELQEGWDPAPLPPVAPDGGIEIQSLRVAAQAPPSLCEAGPCRHYHVFQMELDVQKPLADRVERGTLIGAPPDIPVVVQTQKYCYPDVGIELGPLGEHNIMSCNRWSPIAEHERKHDDEMRARFFETDAGKQYRTVLDAWIASQRELNAELAEMPELPTEFIPHDGKDRP